MTFTHDQLTQFVKEQKEEIQKRAHGPHTPMNSVTEAVLKILLYSRFRKGPMGQKQEIAYRSAYRPLIEDAIQRKSPIQITLLGAPFKNRNPIKNIGRTLPDLAEVAFILKMYSLHASIKSVYEPGIELILIHDGVYYADPSGIPVEDAIEYREYFKNLLKLSPDFAFIKSHELTDLLTQVGGVDPKLTDLASQQAKAWMASNQSRSEVAAAYKKAIRSICPDDAIRTRYMKALSEYLEKGEVSDKDIHRLISNSVYEFKKRHLVVSDMKNPRPLLFPKAIHASGLSHADRLPLWLIRRGRALLPWHGVGVLYKDGTLGVEYAETVHHSKKFVPAYLADEEFPFFYSELPIEKTSEFLRTNHSVIV